MHDKLLIWDCKAPPPPPDQDKVILWQSFVVSDNRTEFSIPKLVEDNSDKYRAKYLALIYDLGVKDLTSGSGVSVIRKAKAIGFNLVFFDPYRDRGYEKMLGVDRVDTLDELLKISDVVSINTPLTNETRGMVDADFISKMKYGSFLINTARGEILANIDDFLEPIKSGKISGLALDVLPEEPPKNSGLIASWKSREKWLDGKVIINPHTSYYTEDSYAEMRKKASENAKRIIEGEVPFNIISSKE